MPFGASAAVKDESIHEFLVGVKVNKDASLSVSETVVYDFGSNIRHGIFREIPLTSVQDGEKRRITIKNVSVTDENSKPYYFNISKAPGGRMRIQVGKDEVRVHGVKTYKINYLVKGAVMFLDDRDEIYWNATGNEWKVPIKKAEAVVFLPEPVDESGVRFDCYTGAAGAKTKCAIKESQKDESGLVDAVGFRQDDLSSSSGLTVAVGLPVGSVNKPAWYANILEKWLRAIVILVPFIILFISYSIWDKKGHDPKGSGTIITQFDAPENLTPLEVGILDEYKTDSRELAAELINFAIRGYLKIKQKPLEERRPGWEHDYELEKLKNDAKGLADFQALLLDKLFAQPEDVESKTSDPNKVKISEWEHGFLEHWDEVKRMCYAGLVNKNFFPRHPLHMQNYFYIFAGALAFLWLVIFTFASLWVWWIGWPEAVAGILSVGVLIFFGSLMPARTESGQRAKEHIEGLKTYLTVAEKDRLHFHNAPEKNPERFEKLLPYAIALGVEKKWASQFDDIVLPKQDWYEGVGGKNLSASALAADIGRFKFSGIAGAVTAKPSSGSSRGGSSGGGSSGGGHGGGGGGSW